ncbi:hypothetical protein SAMN05443252_101581 [Bacillus sp. OV322]|nr:hypothetical protein SAMN05443252_101581 [Bacillus sp. OV322]
MHNREPVMVRPGVIWQNEWAYERFLENESRGTRFPPLKG